MKFTGTIIITNPYYLCTDNDYERTNYGTELDKLGFTNYLVEDTGFGDWSNAIFQDDGTKLGDFCADSGQVCVVLAEELLKYNIEFASVIAKPSACSTVIRDFDGEVEIDTSDSNWTMIYGKGNINFSSCSADAEDDCDWIEQC